MTGLNSAAHLSYFYQISVCSREAWEVAIIAVAVPLA